MKTNLTTYLHGIGVASATDNTFDTLCRAGFDTIEKITAMSIQDIANITRPSGVQIGTVRATQIYNSWHSDRIQKLLSLAPRYVNNSAPAQCEAQHNPSHPLYGKTVCMTGADPAGRTRKQLEAILQQVGATPVGAVTAKTHILVQADPASTSTKSTKAKALSIPILSYTEAFPE